jgi:hypothetical protein
MNFINQCFFYFYVANIKVNIKTITVITTKDSNPIVLLFMLPYRFISLVIFNTLLITFNT